MSSVMVQKNLGEEGDEERDGTLRLIYDIIGKEEKALMVVVWLVARAIGKVYLI